MTSKAKDSRNRTLLSKYGIDSRQWMEIYKLQKGLCPICLKPIFKPNNKWGKLAASVDHDHREDAQGGHRIRGLLCWRCNKYKVGNLTAEEARRVLAYLESDFDARDL